MEGLSKMARMEIIGSFYSANCSKGKPFTVKHFKSQGVPKSTVFRIRKKVDNTKELKMKPRSWKPRILSK